MSNRTVRPHHVQHTSRRLPTCLVSGRLQNLSPGLLGSNYQGSLGFFLAGRTTTYELVLVSLPPGAQAKAHIEEKKPSTIEEVIMSCVLLQLGRSAFWRSQGEGATRQGDGLGCTKRVTKQQSDWVGTFWIVAQRVDRLTSKMEWPTSCGINSYITATICPKVWLVRDTPVGL